ncbi:hypothetical protein DWV00_30515 [Trinickia dinghuensis]|uniref:Uncharacterized protein n=1 Tax=Trinickia dinghuensis TaxID=2291023 RepID=A0A3D8JQ16_9BURK|nr:hypothetical protein DWV00_30515 [Trinickia dinghuensis]
MAPDQACSPAAPLGCECCAPAGAEAGAAFEAAPTAGAVAFAAADAPVPVAALAGADETAPAGADAGFVAGAALAFAPAACEAAAPDGAGFDALAEAEAGAASALATAPVASRAGTFNTAPSFKRLGSLRMNADGLASKIALAARASTVLSCEPVAAAATSASDCPGFTVYCVAAEAAAPLCSAGAEAGVAAAEAGAAQAGDEQTSQAQAIASGTARRVERFVMEVSRAFKRASIWRLGVTKVRCGKKRQKKKASRQGDAFRGSYAS